MKRMLTNTSLLVVLVLALGALGLAPTNSLTTDPEIAAILSNVNPNNIFNTAQALQNFRTRQSCSDQPEPGHGRGRAFSERELLSTARYGFPRQRGSGDLAPGAGLALRRRRDNFCDQLPSRRERR